MTGEYYRLGCSQAVHRPFRKHYCPFQGRETTQSTNKFCLLLASWLSAWLLIWTWIEKQLLPLKPLPMHTAPHARKYCSRNHTVFPWVWNWFSGFQCDWEVGCVQICRLTSVGLKGPLVQSLWGTSSVVGCSKSRGNNLRLGLLSRAVASCVSCRVHSHGPTCSHVSFLI
jgi:hypothetical protein